MKTNLAWVLQALEKQSFKNSALKSSLNASLSSSLSNAPLTPLIKAKAAQHSPVCYKIVYDKLVYNNSVYKNLSSDNFPLNQVFIKGISFNSKQIEKDFIFLCLNDRAVNFSYLAYRKGVRVFLLNQKQANKFFALFSALVGNETPPVYAILVEDAGQAYGRIAQRYFKAFVGSKIAITGSVGKTSFKETLAKLLETKYQVFKSRGNYNNHLGLPFNMLSVGSRHDYYVFELGMNHAGEMAYLSSLLAPDITVITSISSAHIKHFRGLKHIALAKSEIWAGQKDSRDNFKDNLTFLAEGIKEKETLLEALESTNQLREKRGDKKIKLLWLSKKDVLVKHTIEVETKDAQTDEQAQEPHYEPQQDQCLKISYRLYDTISGGDRVAEGLEFFPENYSMALALIDVLERDEPELLIQEYASISDTLDKEMARRRDRARMMQSCKIAEAVPHRLEVVKQVVKHRPLIIDDSYNANADSLLLTLSHLIPLGLNNSLNNKIHLNIILGDILELGSEIKPIYENLARGINDITQSFSEKELHQLSFYLLGTVPLEQDSGKENTPALKIIFDELAVENKKLFSSKKSLMVELMVKLDREIKSKETAKEPSEKMSGSADFSIYYFKASRGIHLEEVVKAIS